MNAKLKQISLGKPAPQFPKSLGLGQSRFVVGRNDHRRNDRRNSSTEDMA